MTQGLSDAYQQWLGIAPQERPFTHYRLLGLAPLESDLAAVLRALEEREAYVRAMAAQDPEAARDILADLGAARHVLLSPPLKAEYDAALGQALPAPVWPAPAPAPVMPPAAWAPAMPAPALAPVPPPVATGGAGPVFVRDPGPLAPARLAGAGPSASGQNGQNGQPGASTWSQPAVMLGVAGGTVLVGLLMLLVLRGGGPRQKTAVRPAKRPTTVESRDSGTVRPGRNGGESTVRRSSPPPPSTWRKGTPPPLGPTTMADLMNQGEHSPLDKNSPTGLLAATRKALADRQIETARNHLEAALGMARSPTEKSETERVRKLVETVEAFWTAVREAAERLRGGDEIRIGDNMCIVVENGGGRIIVRADGRNRQYEVIRELPRALAIGIAARRMPGDGPTANLRIGAFLAVDSWGDRQEARRRLENAGSEGRALLPEIDMAGPVKPGPAGDLGFRPGPGAPEGPGAGRPGPGDKRLPVPDAATLAAAEKRVRDLYRNDFAAARDKAGREALAKKLFDAAERTQDDPALRYCLYLTAHDEAVALGDPDSFDFAAERLGRHFQVDALQMKADDLGAAWDQQTGPQARKALYQYGLALLDKALKAKHYHAADGVMRVARAGAADANDVSRLRELEEKSREIRENL